MFRLIAFCALAIGVAVEARVAVSNKVKASCPINYIPMYIDTEQIAQTCIRFYDNAKGSWTEMDRLCKLDNGGRGGLVVAHPALHLNIRNYIMQHPYLQSNGYWVGGHSLYGSWQWTDGTSMMGDALWDTASNQPDDPIHSHYACIYTPDHWMHSCQDQIKINAICQL